MQTQDDVAWSTCVLKSALSTLNGFQSDRMSPMRSSRDFILTVRLAKTNCEKDQAASSKTIVSAEKDGSKSTWPNNP